MKKKEKDNFNWDSISIQKYYDIKDILDGDDDDITKNVKLVALITDKDEDEIWNMDLTEASDYIGKLLFLNKFELPKSPNVKVQLPSYKLVVIKDLTKINVAQYVDFQNFVRLPLRESMDKILSIFLIPEGKTYNNGYDIIDLQKEIRENLSFRAGEGLFNFFIKKYSKYLIHSLNCLRKMSKKTKNKEIMEKEMLLKEQIQNLISLIG